jgi:hypothetical protein
MSRHWSFKSISGPTRGYYVAVYENKSANTTAEVKIPATGVYHGDPHKQLSPTAAEKIAKKMKGALNQNT